MRKVLITAIVILSLVLAGLLGFIWYEGTHFFVDGQAYAKNARELDLREEEISEGHYLKVQSLLPDCRIIWNVPFQGGVQSSDAQQLSIAALTEEDIRILRSYFPDLKQINAEACRDYEMLAVLAQQLPGCDVSYRIQLGDASAEPDAKTLTLEPGTFVFETLMSNLSYLPQLQSIYFPQAELTQAQREELNAAYPDVAITSSVNILGQEYDDQTIEIDLSALTSGDVEEVAGKLSMLSGLSRVDLMGTASASQLSLEDVRTLKEAAPGVAFQYTFDFYGMTVSADDAEVILKKLKVEDQNFAQNLSSLLVVMNDCQRVVVEAQGPYDKIWKSISSEELAQIREEYKDHTKLVWRIYFGEEGSTLTDAQALRAVSGLSDKNGKDLQYCNEVVYMDLGHNESLKAIDFVSGMTSLEAVIVSGAPIVSLDPFAACKNLKFLEIANCIYLPDINAVKECPELEMLNISFTKIEDLSPIMDLKLTHLCTVKNPHVSRNEPGEQLVAYMEANPDCVVTYKGEQPYGEGWRTDENGKLFGWYSKLEDVFHYSRYFEGGTIRNQMGWRLETE